MAPRMLTDTDLEAIQIHLPPMTVVEVNGVFEATMEAYPYHKGIGYCEEEAADDLLSALPDEAYDLQIH